MRYGARVAVDAVSWSAHCGEITVVMGANGAGKSSTLRVCLGLTQATRGKAEVLGLPPTRRELRPRVGAMLPDGGFYPSTTARRALRLLAAQYANPHPVGLIAERVGLDQLDTAYRRMSNGEQRKLALAAALIGRPELLIADEPTTGLDPAARAHVWELFRELRDLGVSIVTTTHLAHEAQALADRVVMYGAGRIIADGTLDDLLQGDDELRFRAGTGVELGSLRAALPEGCVVNEVAPGEYLVTPGGQPQIVATVTAWCVQHGVTPRELNVGRKDLEALFLELSRGQ